MNVSDIGLLERWTEQRDAEAFAELIRRHSSMVYATCLRILRNKAEAQDAAQDCFVQLLRLSPGERRVKSSLGGWLHAAARHRSVERLRASARRGDREKRFGEAAAASVGTVDVDDVQEYVDEAIASLPEKLRDPLVTHFLEGLSHREIADHCRIPRRTVTSRIAKGIDEVREHLHGRGVSITASALASVLTVEAAQAAPAGLTAALGKLALSEGAIDASHSACVSMALTTKGGTITMAKVATVFGAIVVLATVAALWRTGQSLPNEVASLSLAPAAQEFTAVPPILEEQTEGGAMTLVGVTTVAVAAQENEPAEAMADAATPILDPREPEEAKPVTSGISGHVIDEIGEFVAGAEVLVSFTDSNRIRGRHDMAQPENQFKTVSGVDGAFHVTGVPFQHGYGMVFASAAGMLGETMFDYGWVLEQGLSLDVVLKSGDLLQGRILSAEGAPVADAYVEVIPSYGEGHAISDSAGRFELLSSDKTDYLKVFTTIGDGIFRDVPWGAEEVTDLRLAPQATLYGKIALADGSPAEGMRIVLTSRFMQEDLGEQRWVSGGEEIFYLAPTGEDGGYEVPRIFPNSPYSIRVESTEGKHRSPEIDIGELNSGEERQWDYALSELMHIKGVVVSKAAGKVPQSIGVTVVHESYTPHLAEEQLSTKVDAQGRFDYRLALTPGSYVVTPYYEIFPLEMGVEAFGKSVYLEDGVTTEVRLEIDAPFTISLRLVDEAGDPFADAYIASSWTGEDRGMGRSMDWTTDANGLFSWDGFAPFGTYTLNAGARGFVRVESAEYAGEPGEIFPTETLVLYRAAGIDAVVVDEQGGLIADAFLSIIVYVEEEEVASIDLKTDRNGRFSTAEQLPADATSLRIETIPRRSTEEAMLFWESGAIDLPRNQVLNLGEIVLISG